MTSEIPATSTELARPRGARRVLLESGYAVSAFPLALVGFILVVVNLALGLGLLVLVVGLLSFWIAVMVARGFARLERIRLAGMLGRPAPTPSYLCPRPGDGFWRQAVTPLRDPQSWLDVVWALVALVTGTLAFVVTVAWYAAVGAGLTYWFWQQWLPERQPGDHGLPYYLGLGDGQTAESIVQFVLGLVALVTLPWAVRLAVTIHASLTWVLLSSRAELQGEVARVEGGRDAARLAEAQSLRRLERDIHDGPQQRLVRLTMDLGRARRQVGEDPARAAETLDAALAQARDAVAELRSLSRGIAPPLLVDRGLAAALEEMVTQSSVPARTYLEVPDRLPPHVETAVYFVVAEAMTNVAKHSGATTAELTVTSVTSSAGVGEELVVRVQDDGVGGAHLAKGLGLAGLAQRLAAVDGTLEVDSPPGVGTTLVARIPL